MSVAATFILPASDGAGFGIKTVGSMQTELANYDWLLIDSR